MSYQCCSAVVFFTGFSFFFAISAVFSAITWNDYVKSKRETWPSYPCKVTNSLLKPCSEPDQSIVKVYVEEFKADGKYPEPRHENSTITAYISSAQADCIPKENATDYLEKFTDGKEVTCYSDGFSVRLTRGGDSRYQVATYRLRAIFPIIASIISGLTLIYASYQVFLGCQDAHFRRSGANMRASRYSQDSLRSRIPPRRYGSRATSDEVDIGRPPRAEYSGSSRRPISNRDAKLLINSLRGTDNARHTKDKDGGPDPCPICLEDLNSQAESNHVYLPCSHGYHEDCVLQWFRKGSGSCPYCNHDLTGLLRSLRVEEADSRLMDKSRRQLSLQERETAEDVQNAERTVESSSTGGNAPSSTQAAPILSWAWLSRQISFSWM